jgi:predicted lipoprotein with Yx(FWY)xxD motif
MRRFRVISTLAATLAACAMLAGCGVQFGESGPGVSGATPGSSEHPGEHTVTVKSSRLPGLGDVLVDGQGRTLYSDSTDGPGEVSCDPHTPCLLTWPPVTVDPGATPRAAGGARRSLLGTIPGVKPGTRIVTYRDHPLYHYAGDLFPGNTGGQALFDNGGHWYAVNAAGRPVHRPPAQWSGGRTLETS